MWKLLRCHNSDFSLYYFPPIIKVRKENHPLKASNFYSMFANCVHAYKRFWVQVWKTFLKNLKYSSGHVECSLYNPVGIFLVSFWKKIGFYWKNLISFSKSIKMANLPQAYQMILLHETVFPPWLWISAKIFFNLEKLENSTKKQH